MELCITRVMFAHIQITASIKEALIESSKQTRVTITWLFCYGSFIIEELILLP